MQHHLRHLLFFFFNDTATTEIYTLSLHDALPISTTRSGACRHSRRRARTCCSRDRKSTRLNSSHGSISYAVFCLKKKKSKQIKNPFKQRTREKSSHMTKKNNT